MATQMAATSPIRSPNAAGTIWQIFAEAGSASRCMTNPRRGQKAFAHAHGQPSNHNPLGIE